MKKTLIGLICVMLCCFVSVYAEGNSITCSTSINEGNVISISGQLPNAVGSNQVTLLVGSTDDILHIDQITSEADGSFVFSFRLRDSIPEGNYPFKIGTDADADTYTGTLNYVKVPEKVKQQFADVDITVGISSYVPTISGTISCIEGRSVTVNIVNVTDQATIANETITSADGVHSVSYTLPSLVTPKEYSVSITCSNEAETLAVMNVTVDSSILLVGIDGAATLSDGVTIDAAVESTATDFINKSTTISENESISVEIPNIIATGSYHLTAQCYEMVEVEADNAEISADIAVGQDAIIVSGSIGMASKNIYVVLSEVNGNASSTTQLTSLADGSFSTSFTLTDEHNSGVYNVSISAEGIEQVFEKRILYIKAIPKTDISKESNPALYNALKNARSNLDVDNDEIITVLELEAITGALDLSNCNIESLSGLQSCTGISELYISNNKISDLSPIAELSNLKTLFADSNIIENVSVLPIDIVILNIERNNISSLACAEFLEDINILFAGHNDISAVDFLKNLSKLSVLTLNDNNITDISAIANNTALSHIDISNNNIESISALNNKIWLKELRISNNKISDISCMPEIVYHYFYVDRNYVDSSQISSYISAINKLSSPQK